MKTAFIFFLLGVIAGAFGYRAYLDREARLTTGPATLSDSAQQAADRAKEATHNAGDSISNKLADWHLTGDDIKADLAKTGAVVRDGARNAGEKISDARILTVVKAKYVLDRDLSALDINADVHDGNVTLTGSVAAPALIGRAVALAVDTDGVRHVTSALTIKK